MSRFIPRGVEVAGIGRRFLAAVVDLLPVGVVVGGLYAVMAFSESPTVLLVSSIAAAVLAGGYGLYQWWAYGSRGAGIGARAMGLRLVGMGDGEPVGWWRFFLRQLIFGALLATVVGGIALLVFLVIHERRQGWHDLAVKAVLVQPKATERAERKAAVRKGNATTTVGLPPHLSSAFAPGSAGEEQQDTWSGYAPQQGSSAAPSWLPRLETEPIIEVNRPSSASIPPTQPSASQYQQPQGAPQQQWGAQAQQPSAGQWGQPQPSQSGSQPSGPQQSAPQPSGPQQSAPQPSGPQPSGPQPSGPQQSASQQPAPQQPQPSQSAQPQSASQQSAPQQPGQGPQAPVQQPPVPPHQATPPPRVNQGWIPLPTPTSVIEPPRQTGASDAPRVRQRDFGGVEEDDDGTRIAKPVGNDDGARPGNEGWYVRLDDGREVELGVTVLLGRNPQKTQGDPDVHLVPAGGDGRMISRTHVLIGTDPRGVYVVDRGSTNGTALVSGSGELEPCPVGTQVRVREGQQVSYGNRWFTVLRRPQQT